MRTHLYLTGILLCLASVAKSQNPDSVVDKISNFPAHLLSRIDHKTSDLDRQLTRHTVKLLRKLEKKETGIKKELYQLDSASASRLYAVDPVQQYEALSQKIKTEGSGNITSMGAEYLPYADSLQGSLAFLNKNPRLLDNSKISPAQVENSLTQLKQLQTKMQDADQVSQFIQQRKAQLQQFFAHYTHLPPGVSGLFSGYKQQQYYYSEQLREYRQMLNDPDKMLRTALVLLNKIPAFSSFMKNNSFLAGLFSVPGNYGTAEGMVGLQSRNEVLALIQAQLNSGGPNATAMLQQNLQAAQQDINKIRDKLSTLGGGSGNMDMPDFRPNDQKTKTFLQRLEYGTNLQTQHADYYFPTTTDLGLSVGYKLNEKNIIGIGASYKVGWGSDIRHINVSSEGAGLRSFVDLQLKKSFYASGGYELNYQQPFSDFSQLQNLYSWQQSGLIGISKIVSMNTKVFRKTKVQLLWDFLSYQQVPRGQAFKFRVGYNF